MAGKSFKNKVKSKVKELIASADGEVRRDEPAIIEHTRKKFGEERAKSQRVAILLDNMQKLGGNVPNKKK